MVFIFVNPSRSDLPEGPATYEPYIKDLPSLTLSFYSNVRLNSNATSFFRLLRQILDGHRTFCVLFKPQRTLISSWIMLKAEHYGMFWNPVLMVVEYQSRILSGGPHKSSVQFTGVILKDSHIGTLCSEHHR